MLYVRHRLTAQTTYSCNASAVCGCSANSATLNRILGGEDASSNTWGWMVYLIINGSLQCGGSILSSTWVLTAAHCIPQGSTSVTVIAIGWGKLSENLLMIPSTLQQVTLKTVSYMDPTCASIIMDRNLHFCAGVDGGGKGTCQGDSGGPIMMFEKTWYVIGIVNYAIGCARANYSGVYARVAYYQSWLDSVMKGDSSGFTLRAISLTQQTSDARCNNHYPWLIFFMLTIIGFLISS
ncbi:unnamed protein product [Rotaria sp. Silwood2]|nr:unnamed protein product [Rotaria sp. Silwood2]CAF3437482.1 unnamed protein product [Rotaria sp. Silwood2]CAF4346971.1 unnamed protein product [Rotaria sp. Silwood2]CAF4490125.1 unnamed protein product [Rotaria sp. Silwood2]